MESLYQFSLKNPGENSKNQEQVLKIYKQDLFDPKQFQNCWPCTVCFAIPIKSKQCPTCKHVFCQDCLKDWKIKGKSNKCPNTCRVTSFRQTKQLIKKKHFQVKVKCRNQDCKSTMKATQFQEHMKTCPKNTFICGICKVAIKNESGDEHRKQCYLFHCKKCDTKDCRKGHDCIKELKRQIEIFKLKEWASSVQSLQNYKKKCPNGHPCSYIINFQPVKYSGTSVCDKCEISRGSQMGGLFFHCSQCNYDECLACILKNKAVCTKKHFLKKLICNPYPDGGVLCDECQQYPLQSNRSKQVYHCPICKYDLCPDCAVEKFFHK